MNNLFTRSEYNPILKPNINNYWEEKKLYNPGAIFHNGKYYMLFGKYRIWFATSDNGVE